MSIESVITRQPIKSSIDPDRPDVKAIACAAAAGTSATANTASG